MEAALSGQFIPQLIDWIRQYPGWSGAAVFAVAMLESLVLVGVVVPGAAVMLAAGALVGLGAMELWPTLGWAAAGAIVGDGLSFWVGYRYRDQLLRLWPFCRFTGLIRRGEAFFERHGGKSVAFGRFVGPVRAVIPTAAGMMGMPPLRFATVNVLSALAWAPAYILPGVVFGASLELASEVALRLVLSIVVLIAVVWLARWLIRRTFLFLAPRTQELASKTLAWSHAHPLVGRLSRALVDPGQPESRALLVLALLLLSVGAAFSYILWRLLSHAGPPVVDTGFDSLMQSLRTPWVDKFMVAVTMLGDAAVYAPVAATVLVWLLWRRNFAAAWHWLAALGFAVLLSSALKWSLAARAEDFTGSLSAFAFPSAHATVSTVMYGFLAVLAARELGPRARLTLYMAGGALIVLIAFSRLYLSAHWLSDVAGGVTLGLAWVIALGIAYRQHNPEPLPAPRLLLAASVALAVFGAVHISLQHGEQMQRYALRATATPLAAEDWWQQDWRALAPFRDDLVSAHKQPLNLQWAGRLEAIRSSLLAQGWHAPTPLSGRSALYWLLPDVALDQLPVLPQVHDGRHERLLLTRPAGSGRQWVLRLWASQVTLTPGNTPLWIGTVSSQRLQSRFGLASYPVTTVGFVAPLEALRENLQGWQWRSVQRAHAPARTRVHWDGSVLLVRPAAAAAP